VPPDVHRKATVLLFAATLVRASFLAFLPGVSDAKPSDANLSVHRRQRYAAALLRRATTDGTHQLLMRQSPPNASGSEIRFDAAFVFYNARTDMQSR